MCFQLVPNVCKKIQNKSQKCPRIFPKFPKLVQAQNIIFSQNVPDNFSNPATDCTNILTWTEAFTPQELNVWVDFDMESKFETENTQFMCLDRKN